MNPRRIKDSEGKKAKKEEREGGEERKKKGHRKKWREKGKKLVNTRGRKGKSFNRGDLIKNMTLKKILEYENIFNNTGSQRNISKVGQLCGEGLAHQKDYEE